MTKELVDAIEAGLSNGDGTYSVSIERYLPRRATHKDGKAHEKLLDLAPPGAQPAKPLSQEWPEERGHGGACHDTQLDDVKLESDGTQAWIGFLLYCLSAVLMSALIIWGVTR